MATPENRILLISIIDDDESIREAIAGLIHWFGLRFKGFSSAVEFLASPELADSSCIIADVQILITAYPDDDARDLALADGVVCYLSKPFNKDSLLGCVRTALQSRSA